MDTITAIVLYSLRHNSTLKASLRLRRYFGKQLREISVVAGIGRLFHAFLAEVRCLLVVPIKHVDVDDGDSRLNKFGKAAEYR